MTTFDIRMKRPNVEPAIHANAMHTIEHVVATYLRNSPFREHVVYWGPMGCLTGFYFITNTAQVTVPGKFASPSGETISSFRCEESDSSTL